MRSTQEWIDVIEEVKQSIPSQQQSADPYASNQMSSMNAEMNMSNQGQAEEPLEPQRPEVVRKTLRKEPTQDDDSLKGRKRFSKRHSKNGLAAVF